MRSDQKQGDSVASLDRGIAVALIIASIVVFVGTWWPIAWWVSKTDQRIERLEDANRAAAPLAATERDRLNRAEAKLETILDDINEIKTLLRARR